MLIICKLECENNFGETRGEEKPKYRYHELKIQQVSRMKRYEENLMIE